MIKGIIVDRRVASVRTSEAPSRSIWPNVSKSDNPSHISRVASASRRRPLASDSNRPAEIQIDRAFLCRRLLGRNISVKGPPGPLLRSVFGLDAVPPNLKSSNFDTASLIHFTLDYNSSVPCRPTDRARADG